MGLRPISVCRQYVIASTVAIAIAIVGIVAMVAIVAIVAIAIVVRTVRFALLDRFGSLGSVSRT